MQKIVNPAFKAPPPRNPAPIQQPEYFKRELKSWEDIHLSYELSPDAERKSRHWLMKADHLDNTHTTLCGVYRVKIRPGMFEDKNGNAVPADKTPKQCIVYSLDEYVDDPEYVAKGGATGINKISGDFYTEGRYRKHIGKFDFDERGNIVNSLHMGIRYMYYIPYSPQAIRDLLNKYERHPKLSLACCVANEGGSDPYVGSPRTIHNIDEFCDIEDIDGLIAANIGTATTMGSRVGSFLDERKGGYARWRKYRERLDEEGQDTQLSKLDKEKAAETTTPKKKRYQYRPAEEDNS